MFIFKRRDGLRDFAVFESVFVRYREKDGKYVFKVTSDPVVLRDQSTMVHLMSRKDIKLAAVDLIESSLGNLDSHESWMYGSRIQSVPVVPLSCPRPVASASVALFAS